MLTKPTTLATSIFSAIQAQTPDAVLLAGDMADDSRGDAGVDALIVQNPYAMGYLGVETAANLINGQTGGPSVIDTATTIVTRENMYERESQKILFSFEERK